MAEWTKDQSNQITSLYGQLKGDYEREANGKLFGGSQLPYEDAHHTLMDILKKQESGQHGGLEAKADTSSTKGISFNKTDNAIGLAGIIGTMAAFAAGAYPLGIAAAALLAGTYLLKDKYQTKLKHP